MNVIEFAAFGGPDVLELAIRPTPVAGDHVAVVAVEAAGVNPSDVKNVAGRMSQTRPPRVPGRDFAGRVVDGPRQWIGVDVWGTGGDVGFTRDGTHAELLAVPIASLRRRPLGLDPEQAGSIGVVFATAWHAVVETAELKPGETIVIAGVLGGVGMAAAQVARRLGARVVGLVRDLPQAEDPIFGIADELITTQRMDFSEAVKEASDGGAHVALDCVGGSLLQPMLRCLRRQGRLVAITVGNRPDAGFDMAEFYHNEWRLLGADSLSLDLVKAAAYLDKVGPGFEDGSFVPPPIAAVFPLREAKAAYRAVAQSHRGRVVLSMKRELRAPIP